MTNLRTQESFTFYHQFPVSRTPTTRLAQLRKHIIPQEYRGDKVVYLLHFAPFGTANQSISHYLGITENLSRRLAEHRKGYKYFCTITHELKRRGIAFCVAMTWEHVNDAFEIYLKSWGKHKLFCPLCQNVPFF
jgi:predicted GIY-YIG superfamily endonuclease